METSNPQNATNDNRAAVLVTGGCGFIGSWVVAKLASMPNKVKSITVVDNLSTGNNPIPESTSDITTELRVGDISDKEFMKSLPPFTHVVHLAAMISVSESMNNPEFCKKINVEGSQNVIDVALKQKLSGFVAASSAAIYGTPEYLPLDENAQKKPLSPYGESKWEMEGLQEKSFKAGLVNRTVSLRFFNVFGPRQDPKSPYSGVISKFFDMAKKSTKLTIFGDGKQTRDFVFVQDVANAVVTNLFASESGHFRFNVGTGKSITINQLADLINKCAKNSAGVSHKDALVGDIRHSCSNCAALKSLWSPEVTLDEGMKITYEWFKTL